MVEKVVVYMLDGRLLEGRADECRDVIPSRHATRSLFGTRYSRLEALASGLLLRALLGVLDEDRLRRGAHGKPYLEGGPEFNLTNDCGWAAMAVSDEPVGVDLEEVPSRYRDGIEGLVARRYFDAEELRLIGGASTREGLRAWARAWTRREAILKAAGTGFATDPSASPEVLEGWHLEQRDLGDRVLAVAAPSPFELDVMEPDASALLDGVLAGRGEPRP